MRSSRLESVLPAIKDFYYAATSEETDAYNCIAWALNDTRQCWWPTPKYACYWPPGVARDNSQATVIRIFELHGYQVCETPDTELGFEKIAIYEHPAFGVEHVARQLESGRWTSKIGEWEDIEHENPSMLECEDYGRVVRFMRRNRKDWLP